MSYPFIAAPDHWSRGGVPVRAIVLHHAEGGGTVSWLTRNDGNSSHYVVEYTGRIVQMVREDRAAGSIDPTKVRLTNDNPFTYLGEAITYGVSANQAALGDDWRNPNAAAIAVEIEGFAARGPNGLQRTALVELVADIRTRHNVPVLAHRDFQSYKACPGKLIPWADYGGHGTRTEVDVPGLEYSLPPPLRAGKVSIPGGTEVIRCSDSDRSSFVNDAVRQAVGPAVRTYGNVPGWLIDKGGEAHWVNDSVVRFTETVVEVPAPPQPYDVRVEIGGKVTEWSVTLP